VRAKERCIFLSYLSRKQLLLLLLPAAATCLLACEQQKNGIGTKVLDPTGPART
jgi:hypothetical protein